MSVYTTQLRYICEEYAGKKESVPYSQTPAVIAAARPKIFDFSYPLYDPAYKTALETKIINHYYLREIGAETVGQFKFMLARTMNEIMPYYNKLYESAALQYNPFHDIDYYRDHKGQDQKEHKKNKTDKTTYTGTSQTSTQSERENQIDNDTNRTLNLQDQTTFNTTDTKTLNTSDEKTLNTQDQTTYNTTNTKTLNTSDEKTLNTQDQTTYNITDTKTLNTSQKVRKSDTPQGGLTGIENNNYLSEAVITDDTGTESTARTGTETKNQTGTETLDRTGTESNALTGTETKNQTGTETMDRTGTESNAKTGTETTARTGTDITSISETQSASENSSASQENGSLTEGIENGIENISGTDQYIDHIYGKMGSVSYTTMLKEYRENIINIDMMIINELEVCFMNIY